MHCLCILSHLTSSIHYLNIFCTLMGYPRETSQKHKVSVPANFKYAVKVLFCCSFAIPNYVFFHWYSIQINYVHQTIPRV